MTTPSKPTAIGESRAAPEKPSDAPMLTARYAPIA
jgi:hypothetical protein